MNPEKIVREIDEMAGNVLVIIPVESMHGTAAR